MTSSYVAVEPKDMLHKLVSYEFPTHLLLTSQTKAGRYDDDTRNNSNNIDSTSSSSSSLAMMEEYKTARDQYLQRKLVHNIIDHIVHHYNPVEQTIRTTDSDDVTEFIATSTMKEQVIQQQQTVLNHITNKITTTVQQKQALIQQKYKQLQQYQNELDNAIQIMTQEEEENSPIDSDGDNSSYGTTTMEYDQYMLDQEQQLRYLQEKHTQLRVQLQSLQHQYDTITQQNQETSDSIRMKTNTGTGQINSTTTTMEEVNGNVTEDTVQKLQQENNNLQANIQYGKEIEDFYYNLRLVLEEMYGLRFVRVTSIPDDSGNQQNNDTNLIRLSVQLFKRYDIEITLDGNIPTTATSIRSAILVSNNSIVSGPPIQKSQGDDLSVVQIKIPNFDDIVQYVNHTPFMEAGDNLRTLLREIMTCITMIEGRVQAFTELLQMSNIVATIGPFNINTDQEIVCSMNEPPMTILLRCTSNCPLFPNCIYVDTIYGIGGGWDIDHIELLLKEIRRHDSMDSNPTSNNNNMKITTPKEMIYFIQNLIQQLVDTKRIVVPTCSTPRLPMRNHPVVNTGNNHAAATKKFF